MSFSDQIREQPSVTPNHYELISQSMPQDQQRERTDKRHPKLCHIARYRAHMKTLSEKPFQH